MTPAQISDFLRTRVSLFQHLSDDRLSGLVQGARQVSYEPNEAVVEFGEEASFFGVLLDGELAASVIGEGGQRQVLGRLKTGDTFGEMALMTGDKTLADLIAETRCQVLRIPVALFQSVILTEPLAVQRLSKTVVERFKQMAADPATAAAAFRQSEDPYGLSLKGERPEKILVINCGSSSLKYTFFDTENEANAARGQVERIGQKGARLVHRGPSGEVTRDLPKGGYGDAFQAMLRELSAKGTGVIQSHRRLAWSAIAWCMAASDSPRRW